jgi:signal recognition particle subunit SRP54
MLDKLGAGLKDALRKLAGAGYVDRAVVDELVKDIQRSLLAGDVDVKLVFQLTERIKDRALNEKPAAGSTPREHIVKVVYEELVRFVGQKAEIPLRPTKILLCGLFGSGKTTTAGKLAYFYQKKGLKPALLACDVVRPAAYEQLQQLSEQLHVPFYGEKGNKNAAQIAKNGLQKVKADVYIIDSSGRDALDSGMIAEIKEINAAAHPEEKILVIPADIGQAARPQAEAFQKALGITGVIITKLDGTAKAGGALTACATTGASVKWIGVGEKMDAFEPFEPDRFVSRLIGWGDIQSLVEKAKEAMGSEKGKEIAGRVMEGRFTMSDFYEQIKAMGKMGGLGSVMANMPGMGGMKMPKEFDVGKQEGKMKKWGYAIESMTNAERDDPAIIDASRVTRIAKGSGIPEAEIRELLKQYGQAKKMMKMMSGGGMKRGALAKLARRFKGF